jgi:hypothetical protein
MPRKTVLKQTCKLAPKNESLNLAIAEDNKDSIIADRMIEAKDKSGGLLLGNLEKPHDTGDTATVDIPTEEEAAKIRAEELAESKQAQGPEKTV